MADMSFHALDIAVTELATDFHIESFREALQFLSGRDSCETALGLLGMPANGDAPTWGELHRFAHYMEARGVKAPARWRPKFETKSKFQAATIGDMR